jgi:hypothetical protein
LPARYDTRIPLDGLIAELRNQGFEINTATVLDMQKVLANLDDEAASDVQNLPYLLGPLICRNKEEQEKFYKVCTRYLDTLSVDLQSRAPIVTTSKRSGWLWPAITIAAVVLAAVVYFIAQKNPAKDNYSFNVTWGEPVVAVNEQIAFSVARNDSAVNDKWKYSWTFGGKQFNERAGVLTFNETGQFPKSVKIVNEKGETIFSKTDTVRVTCEPLPAVAIESESKNYGAEKIYRPAFTNPSPQKAKYGYRWYVNDAFVSAQPSYSTEYVSGSAYTVKLVVDWSEGTVHCSADSLLAVYEEKPEISVSLVAAAPLTTKSAFNTANLLWMFAGLLLLPAAAALGLHRWLKKQRKKNEVPPSKQWPPLTSDEKKYSGPYTIEFEQQDSKITDESGISQLAEILRKRHSSDTYQLNIASSIRKTIRAGGFPAFHFTPRTKPTDFLILLDKEYPNGHVTKLFGWVINKLKREEVQFTSYSFYKEPLLFSSESLNHSMLPIDKLARLYPDSIVLIFSNGNGFLQSPSIQLKSWIPEKFRNWQTKLLITPVPKNDWGSKELSFYQAGFTVVPADLNAHQVIADEINFMIDKQKLKKSIVPDSYKARQYNFNRINQLENYLDNAVADSPLVKKWVFALAVYPHINWNITIAIGKALEDKMGSNGKLVHYSNLLAISRIQWMNDGQISDSLQKEMLLRIDPGTEAIARKAVLDALAQLEPQLKGDSLIKDEFVYLQTTNRFLLHAYREEEHALSAPEYERMRSYASDDRLDWVLESYLNNPRNNSLLQPRGSGTSVTLNEYLLQPQTINKAPQKDKPPPEKKADQDERRALARRRLLHRLKVAGVFFLVAIPAFMLLQSLGVAGNLRTIQPATIQLSLDPSSSIRSFQDMQIALKADTTVYDATITSDTTAELSGITIPPDGIIPVLHINTGSSEISKAIDTLSSTYRLRFGGAVIKPRLFVRYNIATNEVNNVITLLSETYSVSARQEDQTQSTRLIYYNEESRNRADSIAAIAGNGINEKVPLVYIPENRTPPASPMLFIHVEDTVGKRKPVAENFSFDAPASAFVNQLVTVRDTSSQHSKWEWFTDQSTTPFSYSKQARVRFPKKGTKRISLRADGGTMVSRSIVIKDDPKLAEEKKPEPAPDETKKDNGYNYPQQQQQEQKDTKELPASKGAVFISQEELSELLMQYFAQKIDRSAFNRYFCTPPQALYMKQEMAFDKLLDALRALPKSSVQNIRVTYIQRDDSNCIQRITVEVQDKLLKPRSSRKASTAKYDEPA